MMEITIFGTIKTCFSPVVQNNTNRNFSNEETTRLLFKEISNSEEILHNVSPNLNLYKCKEYKATI